MESEIAAQFREMIADRIISSYPDHAQASSKDGALAMLLSSGCLTTKAPADDIIAAGPSRLPTRSKIASPARSAGTDECGASLNIIDRREIAGS